MNHNPRCVGECSVKCESPVRVRPTTHSVIRMSDAETESHVIICSMPLPPPPQQQRRCRSRRRRPRGPCRYEVHTEGERSRNTLDTLNLQTSGINFADKRGRGSKFQTFCRLYVWMAAFLRTQLIRLFLFEPKVNRKALALDTHTLPALHPVNRKRQNTRRGSYFSPPRWTQSCQIANFAA